MPDGIPTNPNPNHRETEAEREARLERSRQERERLRHEQEQQRHEANRAAAANQQVFVYRQKSQDGLNRIAAIMAQAALEGLGAQERARIQRGKMSHLEHEAGDLFGPGPRDTMRYYSVVLVLPVVISMNFFLINAPVLYLASSAFADPDAWQAQLATVLVPVTLLLLEIYIGQQLALARRQYPHDVWRWKAAGQVMIAFTPLMILGTMLAREEWWVSYNLVTSLALIVLAGVTDAAIIFGGEQIHTSQAFVWCQLSRGQIQRHIDRHTASYRRAGLKVERGYVQYVQRLNAFNAAHQPPIAPGPFSDVTRQFLNEWLGEEVILPPQRPLNRLDERNRPNADDGDVPPAVPAVRPTPNPVHPQAGEAVPEPEDAPDAVAAERDYFRNLVAGQVRQRERELGAD